MLCSSLIPSLFIVVCNVCLCGTFASHSPLFAMVFSTHSCLCLSVVHFFAADFCSFQFPSQRDRLKTNLLQILHVCCFRSLCDCVLSLSTRFISTYSCWCSHSCRLWCIGVSFASLCRCLVFWGRHRHP